MGAVYVGYDEALDRRVALKVLHRGENAREWLVREGQALARLSHPNVVMIHEVGDEEGRVFLAMELVVGPTLREWLKEKPRTFSEKLRLFVQAARGLAAAHDAGLVHRDFKPDNVLVGRDERARVVDFGIAALASQPGRDLPVTDIEASSGSVLASPLTREGTLLGTPAFMAPEQFDGVRATAKSDQWAFAIALYRAAYDASPFPPGGVSAVAKSVRTQLPTPPPRTVDVPAWLWPILRRALERDPAARFASMEELVRAIAVHVPRDPDLDPTLVVREREILSLVFCVTHLTQAALLLFPATGRIMLEPLGLLGLPCIALALMLAVLAVRRPRFTQNAYGRRLALLFPIGLLGVLAHRVLGVAIGLSGPQIYIGDLLVLATAYALIAVVDHAWLAWLAAISALMAIFTAMDVDHATTILGIGGLINVSAMCVRLYLDRHMTAATAIAVAGEPVVDTASG